MLATVAQVLVLLVALLHAWFLVLEMFLWTHPAGLRTFRQTAARAEATRVLAANQGLYNGFLAAGLLFGLWQRHAALGSSTTLYFLGCVVVAGAYGAYSVSPRIFLVQALPALVAIGALLAAGA